MKTFRVEMVHFQRNITWMIKAIHTKCSRRGCTGKYTLILVVIIPSTSNVVEAQLVVVFRGGNDANPVTEAVLFQELLGQIFEVSLREGDA